MWWATKDAGLCHWLHSSSIGNGSASDADDTTAATVAHLRAACRETRDAVDAAIARLQPRAVWPGSLSSLPSLKALHLDHPAALWEPQQLGACSELTRLTLLHLAGPAASRLRSHHLGWVGKLTALQDVRVRGCTKVRLSVLASWHSLHQLASLALIGLAVAAADAHHLPAFLAAGPGISLTSLQLGDSQGLTFLSDSALQGVGALLAPALSLRRLDLSGCIKLTDAGFQQLAGLEGCLEHLQLHNCMKLGSGAAALVGGFTHLKRLSLRGLSQLSDAQVQAALHRLTGLKQLNLQACSGLTGSFLEPTASRLVELSVLNLSYAAGLQASALKWLQAMPRLQQLSVAGSPAVNRPEALLMLGQLSGLTSLLGGRWACKGEYCLDSSSSSIEATAVHVASGSNSDSSSADASSSAPEQLPPQPLLLPPRLVQLTLAELSCSSSLLQGVMQHLPDSLTSLDMRDVCVRSGGGGVLALGELQRLANLRELNLSSSSSTTGSWPAAELSSVGTLSTLTKLVVSHVQAGAGACSGHAATAEHAQNSGCGASSSAGGDEASGCRHQHSASCSSSDGSSSCTGNSSSSSDGSSCTPSPLDCTLTAAMAACAVSAAAAAAGPTGPQPRGVAALLQGIADPVAVATGDSSAGPTLLQGSRVRRHLFAGAVDAAAIDVLEAAAAGLQLNNEEEQQPPQPQPQPQQLQQSAPWLSGLTALQELQLRFSPWVDDGVLATQLPRLSALSRLDLTTNHNLTGHRFSALCGLTALHTINLAGCSSLCDDGLAALATACSSTARLRRLLLPGCRAVSDIGVAALAALTSLTALDLSSNRRVTSRGLAALFPALGNLRTLVLACGGVCDAGLECMAAAPLASLDLRACWRPSDAGVHALLAASTSLMQVNVDSCSQLSLACCPPSFVAFDGVAGSTQLSSTGASSARPGLLARRAC